MFAIRNPISETTNQENASKIWMVFFTTNEMYFNKFHTQQNWRNKRTNKQNPFQYKIRINN